MDLYTKVIVQTGNGDSLPPDRYSVYKGSVNTLDVHCYKPSDSTSSIRYFTSKLSVLNIRVSKRLFGKGNGLIPDGDIIVHTMKGILMDYCLHCINI